MKIRNLDQIRKLNEESIRNGKRKKVAKPKLDEDWIKGEKKKRDKRK